MSSDNDRHDPLDGPATGGFTADISLTQPSQYPERLASRIPSRGGVSVYSTGSGRRGRGRAISASVQKGGRVSSPETTFDNNQESNTRTTHSQGADSADTALDALDNDAEAEREAELLTKATEPVKGLRMRIMRFTPSWYAVTMGTGICNTLLFLLPWHSTHAVFRAIGAAFLILNFAIFLGFSLITTFRYTWYPQIFWAMLTHPVHSLFLGTIPMGFVTIVSGIALQGDAYGLKGSVQAAAGMWWLALALSFLSAYMVPLAMQTSHKHTSESLTAAWLLPIVPPITVAASGATISGLLATTHPNYALTIWIAAYCMNGIGFLVAGMVLVLYFQRLALHHIPGKEVVVSTFLPLGPCGQGGYALLQLGKVARTLFPIISAQNPGSTEGLAILQEVATPLYAVGMSVGLLTWALGIWFMFLAVSTLFIHRMRGTVGFNLGWWGFTFPLGSLNLLTYALASAFDSMFFKVVGTIMTFCVVALWACVAIPTVKGFYTGSLFPAPCLVKLPDLLEKESERYKERMSGKE